MARYNRTYPQLVVFKEKHGDNFYLVDSKESEEKMFLDVLTDRLNTGWYSWMKEHKPYGKEPSYSREDVEKMPDSMAKEKDSFIKEISKWEKEQKQSSLFKSDYLQIEKSVNEKDGKLASLMIREYSEGEYEGYEYCNFTHIK